MFQSCSVGWMKQRCFKKLLQPFSPLSVYTERRFQTEEALILKYHTAPPTLHCPPPPLSLRLCVWVCTEVEVVVGISGDRSHSTCFHYNSTHTHKTHSEYIHFFDCCSLILLCVCVCVNTIILSFHWYYWLCSFVNRNQSGQPWQQVTDIVSYWHSGGLKNF